MYHIKVYFLISPTVPRHGLELSLDNNPLQCDSRLCWIKKGEREDNITWLYDRKPDCTDTDTDPDTDWDDVILDCPVTGIKNSEFLDVLVLGTSKISMSLGTTLFFTIELFITFYSNRFSLSFYYK